MVQFLNMRKMCPDLLESRASAYEEAADHLGMEWTNDGLDRQQGNIVADLLRKEADKLREKAAGRM